MPATKQVEQHKLQKLLDKLKAYVQEHKRRPFKKRPAGSKLRVFSDCSGISAETIAMTLLGLKQFFTVVGGSESDDLKRLLADAVHEACHTSSTSDVFAKDIFKRNPEDCSPSDIYLAGFPCPAYSKLGRRFGLRDSKMRGIPMVAGLRYIVYHKPPVVLLEQVTGFLEKKHKVAQKMLRKTFAACGYTVRAKVLQTCEHGLPQSRPRLWVVALRKPATEFRFPKALKVCPPLESILDLRSIGNENLSLEKFGTDSETAKLKTGFWILDVGSSERFTSIPKKRVSPCLTRGRCKSRGYYVPRLARRVSVTEISQLQGIPVTICQRMVNKLLTEHANDARFPRTRCENEVAAAFGDGMSINVLQRVLGRALVASGLWPSAVPQNDFWASLTAHRDLEQAFEAEAAK